MPLDRAKINAAAEKFVKNGKLPEAITEYKRLVEDNPRDMGVLNKLGDLCVRAGKNVDAIRFFLRIAEFYAGDGFFLKAIAMYKKVSKLDPANLDCQIKLAGLYQQQGLTIEAKTQYLAVADRYLKSNQIKKAVELFPQVLLAEPDNLKLRMTYADLLVRVGSLADAGREFRQVAQELANKGMLDEALKVAQKGAKIVPADNDMMGLVLTLTKEAEKSPGDLLTSVEQMAKANGDNPRSLALLGEAYVAAGKTGEADKIFRKLRGMEDAPPEVAAAVARYHFSRQETGDAFTWSVRAADGYLGARHASDAGGILDEFLRAFPGHREGLRKRADVASAAGDARARTQALCALIETQIEAGETAEARGTFAEMQEADPQDPRLAELQARLDGGGAPRGRTATPAARTASPAVPIAEDPAPAAPDIQEGALVLDEEPANDLGASEEEIVSGSDALSEVEDEVESGPRSVIQDMQSAPDEDDDEPEDEDFVSEHFTEAEVFVKYGLLEKAKEQLIKILEKYPKHVPSHTKLKEIYYEEGDKEKAVEECLALAGLLKAKNRAEEAQDFVNEAIRIDPNNLLVKQFAAGATPQAKEAPAKETPAPKEGAKKPAAKAAAPAPPAPPRAAARTPPPAPAPELELEALEEEADLEIEPDATPVPAAVLSEPSSDAGLELEIELPETPEPPAAKPAPAPAAASPAKGAAKGDRKPPEKIEEETPEDLAAAAAESEKEEEITIEMEEDEDAGFLSTGGDAPAPPPVATALAGADPDPEKLGEVDFYIDQGLLEEARAVLFQLQKQHPGSPEVAQRFERANRPGASSPAAPAPKPPPSEPTGLDLDVERAFGAQTVVLPATRPAVQPVPRASKAKPVFKVEKTEAAVPEGDFFDLAGELDRSLAEVQVAVDTEEQESLESPGHSLDEIFKAFRKGVEQQVDSQDFETHYNLGIAYKEMGLVDEAIGEFQYAARDSSKTVECCEILGLCFREKGMPQLALKWYQKGLDTPDLDEHESVGLRFDIAEVYREQGDYKKAIQVYTEVYGLDSTYRDVSARIKEMKKLLG